MANKFILNFWFESFESFMVGVKVKLSLFEMKDVQ